MDVRMPELDGIEALSKLKVSSPKTSVLIMTAFGSSNNAIRAMELGAFDYITKPFELDKISHTVKRVIEYRDLTSEVQVLRDEISSLVQTERIAGNSPAMQEVYKTVGKVAKADATVLITGESGTGKELVAEAPHYNSNRRSRPTRSAACAAPPEPPLAAALVEHFLAKHRSSAAAQPAAISEEALKRLMEYDWPGNVRELENVVERAVVLSRGQIITSRELPFGDHEADGHEEEGGDEVSVEKSFFKKSVAQFEKDLIMKALRDATGNRSKAAEMLGIYRRLLYAKIKEYGLEGYPPKGRPA